MLKLSVVIPARNEERALRDVVYRLDEILKKESIPHEFIIVNDNSQDRTGEIAEQLSRDLESVHVIHRKPPPGFGYAVQDGLKKTSGEAIALMMADASDEPGDVVRCYRKIVEGYDCVFGSRFIKGSIVKDYPLFKLLINRIANNFIRILFLIKENDITNAFKVYKKEVIEAVQPLVSTRFNITVEIPLKAISRGFSRIQIPINWYGRKSGVSKLGLWEHQKKYLFSVFYVWLERILLSGEIKYKMQNAGKARWQNS